MTTGTPAAHERQQGHVTRNYRWLTATAGRQYKEDAELARWFDTHKMDLEG